MLTDDWRPSLLVREATRNVFGWGSRRLPALILAAAIGLAHVMFLAYQTQELEDRLADLALKGRNVLTIASASQDAEAAVSRASCEGLTDHPEVQHAGLFQADGLRDVVQIGPGVPLVHASTTLVPGLARADAVVGSALREPAERFGLLVDGQLLNATVGEATPDGVDVNSAVVVPLDPATRTGTACVIVLDAFADQDEAAVRLAAELHAERNPVSGRAQLRETLDPIALFQNRPERFLPLVLGLVGALLCGLQNRLRSSELAVYRLSGTSPRSLGVVLVVEQLLIAGVAVASGSLAALVLSPRLLDPTVPVLWSVGAGALWVAGATLLSVDLPFRRPTDLAKDR